MRESFSKHLVSLSFLALATGLAGCEPSGPSGARVNLYLTDAPAAAIDGAEVVLSKAYLVPAEDSEESAFVTLFDEEQAYDLLDLQNGVTALLGSADVPAGTYAQLRLVVASATITLADPATFADGSSSKTLFVPSGMQTGIKVTFPGTLAIDGETDITIDFDLGNNFKFLGPPGAPTNVLFTPVLTATIDQ